jgi:hypothetical protein
MVADAALEALRCWIDLSLVDGLGPAGYRALLTAFGEPVHILSASPRELRSVVNTSLAERIQQTDLITAAGISAARTTGIKPMVDPQSIRTS